MRLEEGMRSEPFVSFITETEVRNPGQEVEIGVFSKAFGIAEVLNNWPDNKV